MFIKLFRNQCSLAFELEIRLCPDPGGAEHQVERGGNYRRELPHSHPLLLLTNLTSVLAVIPCLSFISNPINQFGLVRLLGLHLCHKLTGDYNFHQLVNGDAIMPDEYEADMAEPSTSRVENLLDMPPEIILLITELLTTTSTASLQ